MFPTSPSINTNFPLVVFAFVALTVIVHLSFAAGVYKDGERLVYERQFTAFTSPIVWAIATVLGGVPIAGIYWLIHHSTLRPSNYGR